MIRAGPVRHHGVMRFVTIGYGDRDGYDRTGPAVRAAAHEHDERLQAAGALAGIAGRPVQVRNHDAAGVVTGDGPYLVSDLPVAGFGVIEAADLDEAITLAAGTPCAVAQGVVEVWPLEVATPPSGAGTGDPAGGSEVIVSGWLRVAPEARGGYLAECRPVIEAARTAPGCLDFHLSADPLDDGRINVYERWRDEASVESFRGAGPSSAQQAAILGAQVEQHVVGSSTSLT